jgi:hypothetical protein
MKYINIPAFIISLAIGFFIVYITVPETRTVYVYPTHDNINSILFKDKVGNCFAMHEEEVECPTNETEISKIPAQM